MSTRPVQVPRSRCRRIRGVDRAVSVAMCRALRSDWDLDAAVGRLLALGVGEREVARALASVRCLDRHEPTVASARAELALAQALAALRGR